MPRSIVDNPWRNWLLDSGSLTQNVRDLAPGRFSLQLLDRRFGRPSLSECKALNIQPRHEAYIREVTLCFGKISIDIAHANTHTQRRRRRSRSYFANGISI